MILDAACHLTIVPRLVRVRPRTIASCEGSEATGQRNRGSETTAVADGVWGREAPSDDPVTDHGPIDGRPSSLPPPPPRPGPTFTAPPPPPSPAVAAPEARGRRTPLLVGAAVLVIVALVGAVLFATRDDGDDSARSDDDTSDDESSDEPDSGSDGDPDEDRDDVGIALPVDPETVTGVLDNGLTYFVRENDNPGGRVELRLAVNAGSALEADDQQGAAHFLEHMLFNGTETYPANELISTLESFGSQFGADVNAYTSYDETVYQLGLTDNTDDLVATAVDVLHQWATAATIDPAQVDLERGVVVEEWRLRDLGLDARTIQAYEDQLLAGSVYAEREPIGTIESIEALSADALRRFYDDWYRPDLMAVVVVGDIDAGDIEELIVETFADVAPRNANPPERPETFPVDLAAIAAVAITTDAEQTSSFAELMYPTAIVAGTTVAALADDIAELVAFDVLGQRLSADADNGSAPYRDVFPAGNAFVRGFDAPSFIVEGNAELLGDSIGHAATEIERLRRFGVSTAELDRAQRSGRRLADQTLAQAESRQDVSLADQYVATWLLGTWVSDADDLHDIYVDLVDELTTADVDAAIGRLFGGPEAVAVFGPEADAALLPTVDGVVAALAAARDAELEPRAEGEVVEDLMEAPEPADVTDERSVIGFTADPGTELTLANGVRVFLYPTDIVDDVVVLYSESPGGYSVIPEDHVVEASLLYDFMLESGVGPFDQTALTQILSDRVVTVDPILSDVTEGFSGSAGTDDLETMLQLVHLYSTLPRVDERAVASVVESNRDFYTDPSSDPAFMAQLALYSARYGAESRHRTVLFGPTGPQLDTISATEAQTLAVDRFGDSTGAVFALVGDFDGDIATDLIRRYLGTLPTGRAETHADVEAAPPPGIIEQTVAAGSADQGTVLLSFSGPIGSDPEHDVRAQMLSSIVDSRLRERLREQLGAAYSPFVDIAAYDLPDAVTESYIEVGGEPARLDEIETEVLVVLAELAATGPTGDELETVKEQLGDQLALFSNEELAYFLVYFATRPQFEFESIYDRTLVVADTTAAELTALAALLFPADNFIVINQIPE